MHKGKRDWECPLLPSVPGQCNELANISKGDLKKTTLVFRPLKLHLQTKRKEKQRPAVSSYNLSGPKKNKILLFTLTAGLIKTLLCLKCLQPFNRSQCWARPRLPLLQSDRTSLTTWNEISCFFSGIQQCFEAQKEHLAPKTCVIQIELC